MVLETSASFERKQNISFKSSVTAEFNRILQAFIICNSNTLCSDQWPSSIWHQLLTFGWALNTLPAQTSRHLHPSNIHMGRGWGRGEQKSLSRREPSNNPKIQFPLFPDTCELYSLLGWFPNSLTSFSHAFSYSYYSPAPARVISSLVFG